MDAGLSVARDDWPARRLSRSSGFAEYELELRASKYGETCYGEVLMAIDFELPSVAAREDVETGARWHEGTGFQYRCWESGPLRGRVSRWSPDLLPLSLQSSGKGQFVIKLGLVVSFARDCDAGAEIKLPPQRP